MNLRRDAAAGAAEIVLLVEARCSGDARASWAPWVSSHVPDGAVNVIPGRCELSIDIRSGDEVRSGRAAVDDAIAELGAIARAPQARGQSRKVLEIDAVACDAGTQARWSRPASPASPARQRGAGRAAPVTTP